MFYIVLVTTHEKSDAESIACKLVEEKLAACVNILPSIKSIYRWNGRIEKSGEDLLIFKTNQDNLDELIKRVKELHSYDVPEILAFQIEKGSEEYLEWLKDNII